MAEQYRKNMTDSGGDTTERILRVMWKNWAIANGAIALLLVMSLYVSAIWLPLAAIVESYLLFTYVRSVRMDSAVGCPKLVRMSAMIVFASGMVMLAVNLFCTPWIIGRVVSFRVYNDDIPYVACLISFPLTALWCVVSLVSGLGSKECRRCQERNGYYAGDNSMASLFYREYRYQTSVMLLLSTAFTVLEYWYYFARYINSNFDNPDRFFFVWMPVVIYLLSLVFMGGRYFSMYTLYEAMQDSRESGSRGGKKRTVVRFLIFCGDSMYMRRNREGIWDTPAESVLPGHTSLGETEARLMLTEQTGISDFRLKYLFTNSGFVSDEKIIHYAVFVDPEHRGEARDDGDNQKWLNTYELDVILHDNTMAPVMRNEFYRIHTITMAWKTYDKRGYRLYPIKHYRPTFRLRDFKDWTVDYDDVSWLQVAHNNEDRHFFRLRNLWERLTGMFTRKTPGRV